jgi:dienelactone hydrolase
MRFLIVLSLFACQISNAQQTVTFQSSDGLIVTADLYQQDKSYPYIILYHQANYSRGEYNETAPKLLKLGYNCLAVDLRSGKEVNFVQNVTAAKAIEMKLPNDYLSAEKDMLASIAYIKKISNDKIVLFGSSYSASLALKIAKNNQSIKAVVAFSPGEYFQPKFTLKKEIAKLDLPIFIGSTTKEHPFIKDMLSGVSDNMITWYVPTKAPGIHGSSALWQSTPGSDECWLTLLMFFKNIKK